MTEKFIRDPNKPQIGSEFVYMSKGLTDAETFTRLAANAFAKAEMRHGVSLGAMTITFHPMTSIYEASVKVVRVLRGNA